MAHSVETPYFLEKLNQALTAKKSKNPSYSLRSFALFLEMNPGTLSAVLSGKRSIPSSHTKSVMRKLKLSQEDQRKFMDSINPIVPVVGTSHDISRDKYSLLFEHWEYFVLLALFKLQDFESSFRWISKKTGIPLARVEECVADLISLGLVVKTADGKWERAHQNTHTMHNIPSEKIRTSHRRNLELALGKLESVPVDERDYTFATIGLDEKGFNKLKKMSLKFRDELSQLDESSKRKKLYRVSIQCFPLTQD